MSRYGSVARKGLLASAWVPRLGQHGRRGGASASSLPSGAVFQVSADLLPVLADNTGITSLTESIGGLVFNGVGGNPKYRTGGLNGKPFIRFNYAEWFQTASLTTGALKTAIDSRNYSIMVVMRNIGSTVNGVPFGVMSTAVASDMLLVANGTKIGRWDGNNINYMIPCAATSFTTMVYSATTTKPWRTGTTAMQTLAINGGRCISGGIAGNQQGAASSGSAWTIGCNPTYQANTMLLGDIYDIIVWPRQLSIPEEMQAHMWACDKYAQAYPWAGLGYMTGFDGDSLTAGYAASAAEKTPTYVAAQSLGLSYGQWFTSAIWGQTYPAMLTNATTEIDPVPGVIGKNIKLLADEYYNQRWVVGNTASQILTQSQAYIQARKAAMPGAKLAWGTAADSGADSGESYASRAAYISGLVSSAAGWGADALMRYDTNATIGVAGAYTNSTNFNADATHFKDPGYAAKAALLVSGWNAM